MHTITSGPVQVSLGRGEACRSTFSVVLTTHSHVTTGLLESSDVRPLGFAGNAVQKRLKF